MEITKSNITQANEQQQPVMNDQAAFLEGMKAHSESIYAKRESFKHELGERITLEELGDVSNQIAQTYVKLSRLNRRDNEGMFKKFMRNSVINKLFDVEKIHDSMEEGAVKGDTLVEVVTNLKDSLTQRRETLFVDITKLLELKEIIEETYNNSYLFLQELSEYKNRAEDENDTEFNLNEVGLLHLHKYITDVAEHVTSMNAQLETINKIKQFGEVTLEKVRACIPKLESELVDNAAIAATLNNLQELTDAVQAASDMCDALGHRNLVDAGEAQLKLVKSFGVSEKKVKMLESKSKEIDTINSKLANEFAKVAQSQQETSQRMLNITEQSHQKYLERAAEDATVQKLTNNLGK